MGEADRRSGPVRALDAARQAVTAEPNSRNILHTLAAILAERGEVLEARKTDWDSMAAGGAREPNGADLYVHGRILEQLGLDADAIAAYRKVPKRSELTPGSDSLASRRLSALGAARVKNSARHEARAARSRRRRRRAACSRPGTLGSREVGRIRREQRAMREHALEALRDRVGPREILGDAVLRSRVKQTANRAASPSSRHAMAAGIVGEAGEVLLAIGRLGDEHAIEQELHTDMGDGAARASRAAARHASLPSSSRISAEDRGQAVKCAHRSRDGGRCRGQSRARSPPSAASRAPLIVAKSGSIAPSTQPWVGFDQLATAACPK